MSIRLILIAAFSLAVTPANAGAWKHWEAWHAIRKDAPHRCHLAGKPPAEIPDQARDRGRQ